VYFRDTAHGFLAWAVATLLSAAVLTSAVGSIVGAGAQAGATAAGGAVTAAAAGASASDASPGPVGYFIDSLFRREAGVPGGASTDSSPGAAAGAPNVAERNNAASTSEVTRIFTNSFRTDVLPPEDTKYVGQVVAQRTGLSQSEAEKRVTDTYTAAKAALNDAKAKVQEAADKARKASAYAFLWLVISMLIGAFVASFAATYGGRRRDL